jgi:hypothetical protein
MPLDIPLIEEEDIRLMADGDMVTLEGKATLMEPGAVFYSFFEKVWDQARNDEMIIIDTTRLTFINSSSLGVLLRIFCKKPQGLKVVFRTNPDYNWQRISIRIIENMNRDEISIT